ncbi:MAG: helix-turn-helix transcriptional regulator [Leptospirillum sp.]
MGFDLMQGVLDLIFLVAGAISIVYLRVVRMRMRQLAIDKGRRLPEKKPVDTLGQSISPSAHLVQSSRKDPIPAGDNREVSQMKNLLAKMTMERSRLQVAFYDAERMIEDLENLQTGLSIHPPAPQQVVPPKSSPVPEPADPVLRKSSPLTDQEKAVSWSLSGQSIPEIAQRLGRSEGEVELILGMARLSGGGAG